MTENRPVEAEERSTAETADEEKPHGMPLASGGGGYGGDPCTGPKAERAGHCPDQGSGEAASQ